MKYLKTITNRILDQQLLVGLLLLNLTLVVIYTPSHYFFEMMQSMAVQILFGLICLSAVFLIARKWVTLGSCLIAILLLTNHLPSLSNSGLSTNIESNFSVCHFNVLKYNQNHESIINASIKSEANLLSFNEVTFDWAEALETGLKKDYPFYTVLPQNSSFGIAVFSKEPLRNVEVKWEKNIPYLSGFIQKGLDPIFFIAAHTIPPTSKSAFYKRNEQLNSIKHLLKTNEGPEILVGDLNIVSWAEPLASLRKQANLRDSRVDLSPTYPSWNSALRIPIDHILHSDDFVCNSFQTVWAEGSDHLGIKVGFSYKTPLAQQ